MATKKPKRTKVRTKVWCWQEWRGQDAYYISLDKPSKKTDGLGRIYHVVSFMQKVIICRKQARMLGFATAKFGKEPKPFYVSVEPAS